MMLGERPVVMGSAFGPPAESQPTSAKYEMQMRTGKRASVTPASQTSIISRVLICTMNNIHKYENNEKITVIANTPTSLIRRTSELGMVKMQRPTITKRLNAADPRMVEGPRSPAKKPFLNTSTMESMISGAEEPSAMSVKLAIVGFHIVTVTNFPLSFTLTRSFLLLIISIADMNLSATMFTPKKRYNMAMPYKTARTGSSQECS
mmetsp:Transcript_31737/g.80172  ORF Transcript_31737/g.80172 Transcript_31737/m.80172 type:complete len:206 (+) Transcript_31737:1561-2178(+)